MSLAWIRSHYPVPAKRGAAVSFGGQPGTIVGSAGGHLRVRLEPGPGKEQMPNRARIVTVHPLWQMDYLDGLGTR